MALKHVKIVGTADDPAYEVGSDEWNAAHTFDDDTSIGHKLTSVTDPSAAQDAATKNYVDTVAQGLDIKATCILATAAALPTNTYNNGAAGVGATLTGVALAALSVDGTAVSVAQRILVKDEVTGANNGIYTVTVAGSAGLAYILTRATDYDQANTEVTSGTLVIVEIGTANSGTAWVMTTTGAITMGSSALDWTKFASGHAAITIGADAEHSLSGQVLSGVGASSTQKGHQISAVALTTPSVCASFSKAGVLTTGTGAFRWYNRTGATLTFDSVTASVGTATAAGNGTISASGVVTRLGSASVSGAGIVAATGTRTVLGQGSVAGAGSVAGTGVCIRSGIGSVAGVGTIAATGLLTALGSASVLGAGAISGSGTAPGQAPTGGGLQRGRQRGPTWWSPTGADHRLAPPPPPEPHVLHLLGIPTAEEFGFPTVDQEAVFGLPKISLHLSASLKGAPPTESLGRLKVVRWRREDDEQVLRFLLFLDDDERISA